jgi:tetratricopeptide (TPR) repeat protein
MKNCMQKFYLLVLLLLTACGGQEVIIKSVPDQADVYIKSLGQKDAEKIGQTPITLSEETVSRLANNDKSLMVLEVRRSGFLHEQIVINDFGNTVVEYDFNLKPNNIANIIKKIDSVGTTLFEAQRLLRAGGYDESIKLLKKLNGKYPFSSLINELLGGAYYFKKEMKSSLLHYDLAYKYNPSNVDSYKMIQFLEKELGVKRPLLEKVRK